MTDHVVSGPRGTGNRHQRRAQEALERQSNQQRFEQVGDIDPAIVEAAKEHSAEIDIVSEADRAWFLANPGRTLRLRPSAAVEITFHEVVGLTEEFGTNAYTMVVQIKPGARLRIPFRSDTLYRTEHHGENPCAMLLGRLQEQYPEIPQRINQMRTMLRGTRA